MTRPRPATDEVVVEVRGVGRGAGFAGIVVEGGAGAWPVVGDDVFGAVSSGPGSGALVACHQRVLARKPGAIAYAEAAVLAEVGPPALRAVRLSEAGAGERVVVTGADRGAGAMAAQIARIYRCHVTAVCSDRDVPLVWDLGVDDVLAWERGLGAPAPFAVVIDTDASVTPELAARLLDPRGRLVAIRNGVIHLSSASGIPIASRDASRPHTTDLDDLVQLVEREGIFPTCRW